MPKKKLDGLSEIVGMDAAESLNSEVSQHLLLQEMTATITRPSAVDKLVASISAQHHAIGGAMAAIIRPSAVDKLVASISAQHLAIGGAMAAIIRPSAVDKLVASISAQHQAIGGAMAAIIRPSAVDKLVASISAQHHAIGGAMAAITNFSEMENSLANFNAVSSILLQNSSALSENYASSERTGFSSYELDNLEDDLTRAAEQFNIAGSFTSFLAILKKLPPLVQHFFCIVFLYVLLPQITSISANLLTPVVESYLHNNILTDREKIKGIKEVCNDLNGISTEGIRFITANNVRLRSEPSTKSEILDELLLGQIVTVLSKERNWIEVTYTYREGETITGWVFTRYTDKFVR